MAQPFVISMKFVGDNAGASTATKELRQDIRGLGQDLDGSRVKAVEMNRALDGQSASMGRYVDQAARLAALNANGVNGTVGVRDDFGAGKRGADIEAYGRQLDELRARYNPLFAAERQLKANLADIRQAHRLGAISASEMAAAVRREEAAYHGSIAAISGNTEALLRNRAIRASAANDNGYQTSNLAAQFQDIAVTSAMGMSPIQIALQQGTQISAALGNQGLRGTVMALGGAFASVLSPVSLLTIALVGLGAFGFQALSKLMNGTDDATRSLEEHKKWLDETLSGYDAIGKAANDALSAASKMPEGVVRSDLTASLLEQEEAAQALQTRIDSAKVGLTETAALLGQLQAIGRTSGEGEGVLGSVIEQVEYLNQLGVSTSTTRAELDAAIVSARELFNTAEEPTIRVLADQVYQLAVELREAKIQADSTATALAQLNNLDIQVRIGVSTDAAVDAIEAIRNLAPELRSVRDQAQDQLNSALGSAPDGVLRIAAQKQYQETIAALDEQDRRTEAEKAARESVRASKVVSDYDRQIASVRERTGAVRLETNVVGLSTFATEKARKSLELETAARKDAIGLTPERIAQIEAEANAYATAAAGQEQVLEAQQASAEQFNFYRGTFSSLFTDMKSGLRDGVKFWQALGDAGANAFDRISDRALGAAGDGIFDWITGAITGALPGGSGGGGSGGGLLSFLGFDTGGWTGGVRNKPRGIVHGEEFVVRAGPAAQHRALLEDINSGRSPASTAAGGFTLAPSYNFNGSGFTEEQARRLMEENNRQLLRDMPAAMADASRRAITGAA
jgi:hypothetical protein